MVLQGSEEAAHDGNCINTKGYLTTHDGNCISAKGFAQKLNQANFFSQNKHYFWNTVE